MSDNPKVIRKQLRNVVQDLLPELLRHELQLALYTKLLNDINKRMDEIGTHAKEALEKMDKRSQDVQGYAVRQLSLIPSPVTAPIAPLEVTSKS